MATIIGPTNYKVTSEVASILPGAFDFPDWVDHPKNNSGTGAVLALSISGLTQIASAFSSDSGNPQNESSSISTGIGVSFSISTAGMATATTPFTSLTESATVSALGNGVSVDGTVYNVTFKNNAPLLTVEIYDDDNGNPGQKITDKLYNDTIYYIVMTLTDENVVSWVDGLLSTCPHLTIRDASSTLITFSSLLDSRDLHISDTVSGDTLTAISKFTTTTSGSDGSFDFAFVDEIGATSIIATLLKQYDHNALPEITFENSGKITLDNISFEYVAPNGLVDEAHDEVTYHAIGFTIGDGSGSGDAMNLTITLSSDGSPYFHGGTFLFYEGADSSHLIKNKDYENEDTMPTMLSITKGSSFIVIAFNLNKDYNGNVEAIITVNNTVAVSTLVSTCRFTIAHG